MALIVVVVAIVVGTLVTRPGLTWLSPVFIGIANIGASAPAIGLLVLFFGLLQQVTLFAQTIYMELQLRR